MPEAVAPRPLPIPDEDSRPFWEGCRRGELLIQHCADCGRPRFHPRHMCPRCQSVRCDWVRASGKGVIFSRVVCHPPVLPAFQDRVPYAVVLVELDEDPSLRMVGNLLGCPPEEARIGRPVRVDFEEVSDEITLPQWRLVE
jgi:uncharacterized OB-fold protein